MGQRLCAGFGGEKASGAPWGPLLMPTPSAQLTRGALTPAEGSEGAGLLYAVLFFFFFFSHLSFSRVILSCCLWAGKKAV